MSVMTMPHATMIVGSQIDGRSLLSSRLDGTSNAEYLETLSASNTRWNLRAYVKKNTVKHQLYCEPLMPRSSVNPSIFALPIFPLSKKDSKYSSASIGINRMSIFRKIFFSSRCAKLAIVTPGAVASASMRAISAALCLPT